MLLHSNAIDVALAARYAAWPTRHLQHGIDIRTLQQWMGHGDIASTMVYLKGIRNNDVQARINKGSLAAFA
ncbi:MAG: hypothetical protein ABSC33_12775 [Candidatus Sulfotelmatobacter sp.]